MNIFDQIKDDHKIQRRLCDIVERTNGDSEGREELYAKLKLALTTHAEAEERYFYKPLFAHDMSQDRARHSVSEHQAIDEYLESLDNTDMSSPAWLATFKKLKESVIHHLDEEEHEVFQIAGRVLDDSQKDELGTSYRKMMDAEQT